MNMDYPRISFITGDGIGPEISQATMRIVDESSARIDWDVVEVFPREEDGGKILDRMIGSVRENRVGIKGPITTPIGTGYSSLTVALRKKLELYANVRPVKLLPWVGPEVAGEEIDLVTIRENTEGLYFGVEHTVRDKYAQAIKLTTREASERVSRFAFDYALHEGRDKVTVVHKANILKEADGMFLDAARKVSGDYRGEVELDEKIVDNMAMQLVLNPEEYDVLLAPNLYGDILSDLTAGLMGGLGLAPGGNFGDDYVVFEAVHGSAPDIAGQDIANPIGLLRSTVMALRHLDQESAADQIENAIIKTLIEEKDLTPDLGGNGTTEDMVDRIIEGL